ncbi:phosphotransferase [Sinorhizobium meliloti]|uniref:phosphotransferase n=1 Tax=Rhizobium meliloti TaxID=382 RepID=UPI000B49B2FC|nr:phosphotransferase enzyme family protein [Sinorhizobium meliloti]ASQ06950.1 phosphotransferase [Sinorhizobium meliloti]MDW9609777.1 phosphotransferase [Sinorhizobium meliloti]MDW9833406.1 phosphotransferase [Sinorhizobium meliloti]MDX0037638.1 phosphotransferase [Sinorhizobium meliloti]MDX0086291.1 phosphotransferase [Sinorhizobium meliloti]
MTEPTPTPATKKTDSMSATWNATSLADAAAAVRRVYGAGGTVRRLSSERDETFLFTRSDGRDFILKIANPAEDAAALEFQDGALLHLEAAAPVVPVPRLLRTKSGEQSHTLSTADGPRVMRLLTFLRGELQYRTPASEAQSRNVGRALAELGLGLEDYHGRPPAGKLMWDISHTLDLTAVVDHVAPERRAQAEAVLAEFERALPAITGLKRRQIIHNDFNPHNVLLDPSSPTMVVGIIDFGDMVHAPLINDLAVALSYHLGTENWAARTGSFVEGFHSVRALEPGEIEVLPVLTRARLAMSLIIAEWRSARFPENRDYIMRNHATAWRGLQNISDLTPAGLKKLVPNLYEA